MIWHKSGTMDVGLERAAKPSVYPMESELSSLSARNYEYKVMYYRFAGEFIYFFRKVGNVSRPNQCGRVHLCPPNHLLIATINCRPTASASNAGAIKVSSTYSRDDQRCFNMGIQVNVLIIVCMVNWIYSTSSVLFIYL